MKKILLGILIGLGLISTVAMAQINGGISSPNYWYGDGVSVFPVDQTWDLGSTTIPIPNGYFGTLHYTTLDPAISETDPLSLHLDQTTPQTIINTGMAGQSVQVMNGTYAIDAQGKSIFDDGNTRVETNTTTVLGPYTYYSGLTINDTSPSGGALINIGLRAPGVGAVGVYINDTQNTLQLGGGSAFAADFINNANQHVYIYDSTYAINATGQSIFTDGTGSVYIGSPHGVASAYFDINNTWSGNQTVNIQNTYNGAYFLTQIGGNQMNAFFENGSSAGNSVAIGSSTYSLEVLSGNGGNGGVEGAHFSDTGNPAGYPYYNVWINSYGTRYAALTAEATWGSASNIIHASIAENTTGLGGEYYYDDNSTIRWVANFSSINDQSTYGNYAGYFADLAVSPLTSVKLATGTYAVDATGQSYFTNGTNSIDFFNGGDTATFNDTARSVSIANGGQGIYVVDGVNTISIGDPGSGFGVYAIATSTSVAGDFENGSYVSYLGTSTYAGYFSDGGNSATFADGTYAVNAVGEDSFSEGIYSFYFGGTNYAGTFSDGTRVVTMTDGGTALYAYDGSGVIANLAYQGRAGSFEDMVVNTVYLADGTNAITAIGTADISKTGDSTVPLNVKLAYDNSAVNSYELYSFLTTGNYMKSIAVDGANTGWIFQGLNYYDSNDPNPGSKTIIAGFVTETPQILDFGTNFSQLNDIGRDGTINGAFFRIDTRSEYNYQFFNTAYIPFSGPSAGSEYFPFNVGYDGKIFGIDENGTSQGSIDLPNAQLINNLNGYPTGGNIVLDWSSGTNGDSRVLIASRAGVLPTDDTTSALMVNGNEAITSTNHLYFNAATEYINSANSGYLDLHSTNDTRVYTGANKTLELQTAVYEDVQFPVSSAKVPAANYPAWETFTTNTNEYSFAVNDYIDTPASEVPHQWVEGTAGDVHLHITLKGAQNTGSNKYAKFSIQFALSDHTQAGTKVWTEPTALTAELTIPTGTAALTGMYLDIGDLTLTGYKIGTQIKARIKRIASTGGGGTNEYSGSIFITQLGVHMQRNTLGSRQETVK